MSITIATVLDEPLNHREMPLAEVLERHFVADYRQRTNGRPDDRAAFARHACKLREIVASARIEVLNELRDGDRYADRHRFHIAKTDGTRLTQAVCLFARLDASGRFAQVDEAAVMLEGHEADRNIGTAR